MDGVPLLSTHEGADEVTVPAVAVPEQSVLAYTEVATSQRAPEASHVHPLGQDRSSVTAWV